MQNVKKIEYEIKRTTIKTYLDILVAVSCVGVVINGEEWKECESKTKEAFWKANEDSFDFRIDQTCEEYYDLAKSVKKN